MLDNLFGLFRSRGGGLSGRISEKKKKVLLSFFERHEYCVQIKYSKHISSVIDLRTVTTEIISLSGCKKSSKSLWKSWRVGKGRFTSDA